MKLRTTKKEIKQNSGKIIKIGYCNAQTLLGYESAFAYTAGSNGWGADYYDIDGVIISTGYDPIGDEFNHEILRKYEQQADKIRQNYRLKYETKVKKITALLKLFLKELQS